VDLVLAASFSGEHFDVLTSGKPPKKTAIAGTDAALAAR
jgi:hypothetical protein